MQDYRMGVKGIYTKNGFTEPYDSALTPFYYGEVEMSLEGARVKKNYVEFKPYLRPMSSMTEEEENKYNSLNAYEKGIFPHTEEAFDWLLANHFDFRGLIEKSLALKAPENMYEKK